MFNTSTSLLSSNCVRVFCLHCVLVLFDHVCLSSARLQPAVKVGEIVARLHHVSIDFCLPATYQVADACVVVFSCQANHTLRAQWANGTGSSVCEQSSRPRIYVTILQLFSMFGCGVAMSSWMVTSSSCHAWKNFFRKYGTVRDRQMGWYTWTG